MIDEHKLTTILHGRMITKIASAPGLLAIGFDDGSLMNMQRGSDICYTTGGIVDTVQQSGATLVIRTEDGGILTISLANLKSSVTLIDIGGGLVYAD
jgi:hypothetical protein